MKLHDENFMREALLEAKKAFAIGEVPVGAVLVLDEKIFAHAHNLVEQNCDASAHAELLCLQEGAKVLGNWRLQNTTLYCTLEPCAMCAGAMALFRIKRLVYGAPDLRHGANGSVFDVLSRSHPIHQVEVESGVCEGEAKELMQTFFRERRKESVGKTF
ncbi:MAG: tRNA-specific adenosine deaminase [Chlamydiae bacterium]|nr:tRNA-specific adenosine deaminase [Chlamydiota bacterium]